jgi:Tol biopolymer transport system component/DNA-binding winged helix-turn-helix (wHTH) protein
MLDWQYLLWFTVLEPVPNSQVMRFGNYEVDVRLGELRKNGIRVKLTGQPFQILVILLEHPGDLVTREQLQRRLWQSDTFVDFESGLNAAINRVREALGDSAENPRFVETLPRRGYRFIAPLIDFRPTSATLPAAESNLSPAQTVTSPDASPVSGARERRPVSRRLKVLLSGISILAVLVVAVALFSRLSRRGGEWDFQAMKLSRVTQSGNAVSVAISPDGHYVVYALRKGEKQSLIVRQVATGSDVQILPPDEVMILGLIFSPDANYIDFVRSEKPDFTDTHLYRIPALGGTPHLAMQGGIDFGSSYSPDGRQFAFLRVNSDTGKVDVLIAKADGTDQRVLASRPYSNDEIIGVAWSPDGKTVAFTTSEATKELRSSLWAISVADGSVREIYSTSNPIGRPRWLPDGSGLLAPIGYADQTFRGQLWFISYPRGEARRLTNDLMDYQLCCLDLTADGKTLVDTELSTVSDLWVATGNTANAKQITPKEFVVGGFSWMPNGRIIFASQDGKMFVVNPDGIGRSRLTPDDGPTWDPSVCGDGRYIVYAADREQKSGIWRMNADGSNPIRIADETLAVAPQCSPDGKWVVYLRGPSWTPVKVPITGAKPPEVLAKDFAFEFGSGCPLRISPDGKRIMYLASPEPPENPSSPSASNPFQLKVIPSDGGAELYKFDWPASANAPRWAPAGDAVEYALTRNGVSNIWRQKLGGGAPKQITNFESGLIFGFDWSHDGRQLALTRGTESSDVVLISNFR